MCLSCTSNLWTHVVMCVLPAIPPRVFLATEYFLPFTSEFHTVDADVAVQTLCICENTDLAIATQTRENGTRTRMSWYFNSVTILFRWQGRWLTQIHVLFVGRVVLNVNRLEQETGRGKRGWERGGVDGSCSTLKESKCDMTLLALCMLVWSCRRCGELQKVWCVFGSGPAWPRLFS